MKTFYSAEDIQHFADQGQHEISIDDKVVLTDLAKQTAHMLGIRITQKPSNVSPAPITSPRPEFAGKTPASGGKPRGCQRRPAPITSPRPEFAGKTPASGGKPRGCQRRPALKSTPASDPSSGSQRQVVDQLVETIKRIKGQNIN